MKNLTPTVSIIIPCRNERHHIEACLSSALAQEEPQGGFEVIVADGMSDDGTREILARLEEQVSGLNAECSTVSAATLSASDGERAGVRCTSSSYPNGPEVCSLVVPQPPGRSPILRIIDNPGLIVSTGLNTAIRAARGAIIIRMDAHTEYAPDYLARCVEVLGKTRADNVGGPWLAKGDGYVGRAIAAAFQSSFAVGGARGHDANYEGPVDTVYLGCWSKETFERFGYFDEELVRNQDDEHNLRITRGGGKVYQSPKIKSWYRLRGTLPSLFKQYMQYGYWKVRVIQKHKLPASPRHLVPAAFVLALTSLFLLFAFGSLLSAFAPNSQLSALNIPIPIFSFHISAFSFSFLAALGTYALAVLVASVHTAARTEWKLLPVLPIVFPCYHWGYGFGFLRGVLDFVIRRRRASPSFTKLTRGTTDHGPLTTDH